MEQSCIVEAWGLRRPSFYQDPVDHNLVYLIIAGKKRDSHVLIAAVKQEGL